MKNFSINPGCLLWKAIQAIQGIQTMYASTRSGKENLSCQYTCPKRLLSAGPLEILILSDSDLIGRFLSNYISF